MYDYLVLCFDVVSGLQIVVCTLNETFNVTLASLPFMCTNLTFMCVHTHTHVHVCLMDINFRKFIIMIGSDSWICHHGYVIMYNNMYFLCVGSGNSDGVWVRKG